MSLLDRRWFAAATLIIVMLAGCYVRFDSLVHWLDNEDRYFFDNQQIPLMLTVDAYYYLDIAKAVQEGTYDDYDNRRLVPDGYHRSPTPPLLSVLTALLSKIFDVSLEWVAIVLPAVLGMLLAIPVYLLGYGLAIRSRAAFIPPQDSVSAARASGLVSALFALISPFLVTRNSIGWFDTDILNVSFAVLFAWLAMELADSESRARTVSWLFGYALSFLVFLWWWDQSLIPVFGLAGVPLLVATAFLCRRSSQHMIPLAVAIVALLLAIVLWKGFGVLDPIRYWHGLSSIFGYITSDIEGSVFRAAGTAVSEQVSAPLAVLAMKACGGWLPSIAAFIGLLALAWMSKRYFLFLVAIVLVAVLSSRGLRFLIFCAPLFGLGIGALVYVFFCRIGRSGLRVGVLAVLLLAVAWAPLQQIQTNKNSVPRRNPVLFDAMKILGEKAEKDAVVWASWGHGHPLVYYTQKGVIGDGIFHSSDIQYVLNFPLATSNYRLAANWMSFYVAHGRNGLREANTLFGGSADAWAEGIPALQYMLGVGVEGSRSRLRDEYGFSEQQLDQALTFLFPGATRPVYLFLDYLLLRQPWFVLGRWDVVNRSGPTGHIYKQVSELRNDKEGIMMGRIGNDRVTIDAQNGRLISNKKAASLKEIRLYDGKKLRNKKYPENSGKLVLTMMFPVGIGVLADTQTADTLLTRLFFELRTDQRFFRPVAMQQPYYSIWLVTGEKYVD